MAAARLPNPANVDSGPVWPMRLVLIIDQLGVDLPQRLVAEAPRRP